MQSFSTWSFSTSPVEERGKHEAVVERMEEESAVFVTMV